MKETTNIESPYLCHCMKITAAQFDGLLAKERHPTFAGLKGSCGVGSVCSACELEAKGAVSDYLTMHPEKAGGERKKRKKFALREELRFAYRELRKKVQRKLGLPVSDDRGIPSRRDYHTGIVFFRQGALGTRLALSNLAFPESPANAKGETVTFRATLYGGDGARLAVSGDRTIRNNATLSLSADELFPEVTGDFIGGLYVDFDQLRQTGSLRTYGILEAPGARCHFHDKFGLRDDPGYYINPSPFEPGETCWLALANCQPRSYESDAFLSASEGVERARLEIGPMAARWMKLSDLFPGLSVPPEGLSPALFWLENPQHVMLYFFWQHDRTGHWIAQHH